VFLYDDLFAVSSMRYIAVVVQEIEYDHDAFGAKLLLAPKTVLAFQTGSYIATNTDTVSYGKLCNTAPYRRYDSRNFMTGNHRKHPGPPIVVCVMNVGVANTAILDID
jgi:hypothetical protein